MKSFVTRLISGIFIVLIALLSIIKGGDILFAVVIVLSMVGLFELQRVFKVQDKLPGIIGYLAAAGYYALLYFGRTDYYMLLALASIALLLFVYVFTFPKYTAEQIMSVFFGVFYVAVMLSYIYQTRMLSDGAFIVWLIFIASWGSDTGAYCVGKLLGKHKMTPKLSPNKSVEGAIGGVVVAVLLGTAYAWIVQYALGYSDRTKVILAVICGLGSILAQMGDLAASAIKRNKDIKDYGNIIPGHGGVLDRFDSVIVTAPVIYYLAFFFGKMTGIM
ncbi:MAG: phosphatidate cytidylyltransferase [Lachnospiraceae bacterium]|nr:phosphatidate cytidylyltransferase [Lachnospiraceae bacterium]